MELAGGGGLALRVAAMLAMSGLLGAPAWGQAKAPVASSPTSSPSAPAIAPASGPAPVVIYTKDNVPPPSRWEDLPLQGSVSQYGITWTFEKPARVGQFVNGDFYVVGPVTIKAVDPRTLTDAEVPADQIDRHEIHLANTLQAVRNGSMLNPPAARAVAFDSGVMNWFRREGLAVFPVAMKPGDSLVSTISLKVGERARFVYHAGGARNDGDNSPIKVAAVLTCVAAQVPPDAFRPAFCDRKWDRCYYARDLRRDLLPKLERVPGARDPVAFAEVFQKPWVNLGFFGFDEPMENMPHYGQWVGQASGDAALLLCLDYSPAEKERLLVNFVQVGIDYWGMIQSGHPGWEGWGGHGSGRKLPIVFAGHLLGDDRMASPTKTFPKALFGEDTQTRYGQSWTGAKVVFAGHSGIQGDVATQKARGPYEHLHPSQWDQNGQVNTTSEAYRRANTSCCWVAEGLAGRLLGLEGKWDHDSFFDYVDRWMTEDDANCCKEIIPFVSRGMAIGLRDPNWNWVHEGYAGEDWVKAAWEKHRSASKAPTDGWRKDHGEQAAMLGPNAATTPRGKQPSTRDANALAPDPGAAQRKYLELGLGGGVALKLVEIPAGKFLMGSPEGEDGRLASEGPQHEVTISKAFYMGVTEVTQAQYEAVMGKNPSQFKGRNNPVEQVSWNDAVEFCRKLSAKTGHAVRLPTEAQWEYACRAGTKTPFHTGDTITSEAANFDGTQPYVKSLAALFRRDTTAVGSFAPNLFGLYDMHGNVWEWCADWFDEKSYTAEDKTDPTGPASGAGRVLRGGCWYNGPRDCRSASRYWFKPDGALSDFGFRVAVDVK